MRNELVRLEKKSGKDSGGEQGLVESTTGKALGCTYKGMVILHCAGDKEMTKYKCKMRDD